jgi:hypothetical protein
MLLDMNTPYFCFSALYTHDAGGQVNGVEYLHKDMANNNGEIGALQIISEMMKLRVTQYRSSERGWDGQGGRKVPRRAGLACG